MTDVEAMTRAVRWVQDKLWVDRLEATIEAHTLAAAQVREACTIPGTSVRTAWLCRDKPSMKEVLREAGVPTAASAAVVIAAEARAFAEQVGFPLILKPRSGAGASDTIRVGLDAELEHALGRLRRAGRGVDRGGGVRRGARGLLRHASPSTGRWPLDFVSHYYPNVLEAMRTRWISPQFVSTNRLDTAPEYGELREMGAPGHRRARHRHLGHAHGVVLRAEGAAVLRDRLPAARRGRLGPLLGGQRHRPLPRVGRRDRARRRPARRRRGGTPAGSSRCGPTQDGHDHRLHRAWTSCSSSYGEWVIDAHLPSPGTPTQAVEAGYMANAYVRMRHPDYDTLRGMLDAWAARCTSTPREGRHCSDRSAGRRSTRWPRSLRAGRAPVATITAGWQEREPDDAELDALLDGRGVNLALYRRWLDVQDRDPEYAAGRARLAAVLAELQELYLLRLDHALQAVYAVQRRSGTGRLRADALAEARRRRPRARRARTCAGSATSAASSTSGWPPHDRPVIAEHRAEVAALLGGRRRAGRRRRARRACWRDVLHLFNVAAALRVAGDRLVGRRDGADRPDRALPRPGAAGTRAPRGATAAG